MDDDETCVECDGAKSIMGWPCPVCQSGEAAPALMVPRPEGPAPAQAPPKPAPEPPHDTEDVTTETPVPAWMWGDA